MKGQQSIFGQANSEERVSVGEGEKTVSQKFMFFIVSQS